MSSDEEEEYTLHESRLVDDPNVAGRWTHIEKILGRASPLANDGFEPDVAGSMKFLREDSKVLCIGAGGLGCDLLKCLALSGFRSIHVIDMDTIDPTNLNRQFLFRHTDIDKPKCVAAAAFVNKRVSGVQVHPFMGKMQDKPLQYYQKFHCVICGLDSVPARRWINSTLVNAAQKDENGELDLDTLIPMIDAGTEGFKGHTRVIFPGITSCLECTVELFPPTEKVAICTIAATPRNAAHCIQWAALFAWEEEAPFGRDESQKKNEQSGQHPPIKYDMDKSEHVEWLTNKALARAEQHGIEGVTYKKTQGVLKNIIPAIASTNALAAAAAVNEALKLATDAGPSLKNCMMFNGEEGAFVNTQEYLKNPNCTVCGKPDVRWTVSGDLTLAGVFQRLKEDTNFQFLSPGASTGEGPLYMRAPKMLEAKLKPNLDKTLRELIKNGGTIEFTDPALNNKSLPIKFTFEDE